MDDFQFVRGQLVQMRVSDIEGIAKAAGVPKDTAIKIKYGQTKNPQFSTVKKLATYFRKREQAAA
jgi:predicted transcriptional regulator